MKKQKGITLIALVVTIVVLLILAGIALNLVLGDNGIITRAKEAKVTQEEAAEKEKIEMEVLALCIDDGTNEFDVSKLGDKVTIDGKEYKVVEGEVENGQNYEITKDENGEFVIIVNKNASNLILNTKYYFSGVNDENNMYFEFYSDGYVEANILGTVRRATYIVEGDVVKFRVIEMMTEEDLKDFSEEEIESLQSLYYEYKIVKDEQNNNNILYNKEQGEDMLATSSDGLMYFSGEKFVSNNGDYIILNGGSLQYHSSNFEDCVGGVDGFPKVVFYNGIVYASMTGEELITSEDNCETLIFKGETFTKTTEE